MTYAFEKAVKNEGGSKKIDFEYFAAEAKEAAVAGSFNDWKPAPLKRNGNGKWSLSLKLKPGRYEYRYLIDGTWQNDQRPVECVPNAFGTWNCVLEISR